MANFLLILAIFLFGCKTMYSDKRCRLTPDKGPCDGTVEKYYYDQVEKKCKSFTWGGCHGVVPFDFLEECEACTQDIEG